MYIRFVVGKEGQDHRRLTGIIQEADDLEYDGCLESYEADWLDEHLPVPAFPDRRWPYNAVCWFKNDADRSIRRMWDLTAILSEHSIPVRVLHSSNPGKVLYEDDFQVVVRQWREL